MLISGSVVFLMTAAPPNMVCPSKSKKTYNAKILFTLAFYYKSSFHSIRLITLTIGPLMVTPRV